MDVSGQLHAPAALPPACNNFRPDGSWVIFTFWLELEKTDEQLYF